MSMGERTSRAARIWMTAATLLVAPQMARPSADHGYLGTSTASWQDQDAQDREQEKRDREQEKRDREQEKLDREQEKRDREQERLERLDELYSDGREALDEDRYDQAAGKFRELADMNGPQTDAALYWRAYSENKLGQRDSALTTIADLEKRFAQSRWIKDARALKIEVQQSSGQPAHPESQPDEELKMLAITGLMNSDPQRAMPLLEKVLNGPGTPKEKSKALFVLAQNGSAELREVRAIRTCNAKPWNIWECSAGSSHGKRWRRSMRPPATYR